MDVAEFVLARVAEAEAPARFALELEAKYHVPGSTVAWQWGRISRRSAGGGGSSSFLPGAPSPASVLAQCAALRVVVDDVLQLEERIDGEWGMGQFSNHHEWSESLRALASIWSGHPDYDPQWVLDVPAHS